MVGDGRLDASEAGGSGEGVGRNASLCTSATAIAIAAMAITVATTPRITWKGDRSDS